MRVNVRVELLILAALLAFFFAMMNLGSNASSDMTMPRCSCANGSGSQTRRTPESNHEPASCDRETAAPDTGMSVSEQDVTVTNLADASPHNLLSLKETMTLLVENETIDSVIDLVFDQINQRTEAFGSHDAFLALQAVLQAKMKARRVEALRQRNKTDCIEHLRTEQVASDGIYRVPCVPWNTSGLASVKAHPFGLWARFVQHETPVRPAQGKEPAPLSIAVEMSGHMRTWQKTYRSLVDNLLKPNNAKLFAATYPDIGDKRFGIRVQDRDEPVLVREVADNYRPYLGGLLIADAPTVRKHLQRWFPNVFHLQQWSWMIYQLFMMEVAHNITLAHSEDSAWDCGLALEASELRESPMLFENETLVSLLKREAGFEVIIRVRPDLYIVGSLTVLRTSDGNASIELSCHGETMYDNFTTSVVLRAPHHPVYQWHLDPLSDHSAIGFVEKMSPFLRLFQFARDLSPNNQERVVFTPGNTAERMWSQHVSRLELRTVATYGWHVMIRNAAKWQNGTGPVGSQKKVQAIQRIFGVTDPETVGCPDKTKAQVTYGGGRSAGRRSRRRG